MRASEDEKSTTQLSKNKSGISTLLLRSIFSSKFKNLFRSGSEVQTESREMDRIWCRLYLCQTISKHFARHHLDKSRFLSHTPLWQEERFQLDMSHLTSRALALDHTHRCRAITTHDQTSTTSSTVVASSCLHKLQRVQQPTQLHHC